jgi:CO dehydrogenase/acetyl-CoA synthase beta subunit
MIVQRGHTGMTPAGMKFSTLAGSVGGGMQTPGFMGIGRNFITSKKFLYADGGLKRIVWMTKNLKESLKEKFAQRAARPICSTRSRMKRMPRIPRNSLSSFRVWDIPHSKWTRCFN